MSKYVALILLTFLVDTSYAEEYRVSSAQQISKIQRFLKPGDTVVLEDGIWHNQRIELKVNGSEEQQIRITAQTPGQVIFNGNSYLSLKGSYAVVSGLMFRDGALKDKGHIIRLNGSHLRLTQSAIIDYNPDSIKTRYFWVSLAGHHHRVDHNFFSGQNHSGVTTVVWLNEGPTGHHRIDNNYYGQRPPGDANGFETIRIGTGKFSHLNTYVLVENNVFEESDGEIEIISNKSNYNVYRNNTFINSAGTLTLRQGSYNVVEGNYFLGQFRKGSGGVRVISTDQLIVNNHFESLAGRAGGIVSVTAGNGMLSAGEKVLYPRVERSVIVGNVCVNNDDPCIDLNASFGSRDRDLLAENLLIANNIFYQESAGEPFVVGKQNDSAIWVNNFINGAKANDQIEQGVERITLKFKNIYPQVNRPSILPKPLSCQQLATMMSEAKWNNIDAILERCKIISNTQSNPVKPLFREDVGPDWMREKDALQKNITQG